MRMPTRGLNVKKAKYCQHLEAGEHWNWMAELPGSILTGNKVLDANIGIIVNSVCLWKTRVNKQFLVLLKKLTDVIFCA